MISALSKFTHLIADVILCGPDASQSRSVLRAANNDGDPELAMVEDAMTPDILSCSPDDNIVEVAADMLRTRQRRRPV